MQSAKGALGWLLSFAFGVVVAWTAPTVHAERGQAISAHLPTLQAPECCATESCASDRDADTWASWEDDADDGDPDFLDANLDTALSRRTPSATRTLATVTLIRPHAAEAPLHQRPPPAVR